MEMKKIILILFAFISVSAQSQTIKDWFLARDYYRLGDSTVTFWYGDTLINTEKAAQMIEDSIANNADSIYVLGQNEWIGMRDTIYLIDSSRYSDTAGYALVSDLSDSVFVTVTGDTLFYNYAVKFTGQSGTYIDSNKVQSDTSVINNYLDVNGNSDLNGILFTGSTKTAGAFYTGGTTPTNTNRLNFDGDFRPTEININSTDNYPISVITSGIGSFFQSTTNTSLQCGDVINSGNGLLTYSRIGYALTAEVGGALTSNENSDIININRTHSGAFNTIGNIIDITDNPSVTGTISGKVLTATIGSTERISLNPRSTTTGTAYFFDTDSIITSGAILSIRNQGTEVFRVDSNGISIGGGDVWTSSDTITLKDAVEAETFEYIQLDTANESYSKGKLFYQKNTNALTFYNDISGFSHQPGYEFVRRVYNGTASTIPNGRAVRKIGTYKNGEIIASVALAGCSDKDSSYVYGIATVDIPSGSEGIVTRGGDVRNLNNPGLNDTIGYLGFAGEIIDTSPEAPNFSVKLCDIIYSDNDSGQVDVNISDPIYYPNPSFDAYFEDSLITITNPGTGVYAKITNALNNALIQDINIGYTFQGDSVSPKQDGKYTVLIAPSFKGDAAQNDLWRIGLFVDNVKYRSISRTSSSTNHGGVPFPVTLDLTAGQWLSFRISNESDGTRDAVLVDLFISITYIP